MKINMMMKNILLLSLICMSVVCYGCEEHDSPNNIVKEYNNLRGEIQGVPKGMKLVWSDEFNGTGLDISKWCTQYYSTMDFREKTNYEDFLNGTLPEPGMEFTGNSLILYVDDTTPSRPYWPEVGRRISSIQTYNWKSNENLLGDKVGGYIEARIRRNATEDADLVNVAFWFDSPGPDLKYFIEEGNTALGVEGIRPHGQAYEIDMCENMNTQIVLHGNVTPTGIWESNIAQYLIERMDFKNRWVTHSLLWTPTSLKFYIDGELKVEYSDPEDIKAPNHFLNIYFGAYGKGGKTTMEVDYVRFYQWSLEGNNELPNGNFEYAGEIAPLEGNGSIIMDNTQNGEKALKLEPGQKVYQYVYVDSGTPYDLEYWSSGNIEVKVENIIPVRGIALDETKEEMTSTGYKQGQICFVSKSEKSINKATVKVSLTNTGKMDAFVDNLVLRKK